MIGKESAYYLIVLLAFTLNACSEKPREVDRAFYHWQTTVKLSDTEKNYLQSIQANKIYLRFFDIDIDQSSQERRPQAIIRLGNSLPDQIDYIPTVFITNRSLIGISNQEVDSLAYRTSRKINSIWNDFFEEPTKEIQIDCDWSGKSRDAYFRFLKQLKLLLQRENIQLSATIRLHQIRYPDRTGVPPVDKGMLMFYNMGNLDAPDSNNSILDIAIAEKYISPSNQYPIQLDFALPIFSWGVLYRDNKMIKLINNLRAEVLAEDERFQKLTENQYKVEQSTYLEGYYLYKGDRIRCEKSELSDLQKSAGLLAALRNHSSFTVSFYHLDTATIKYFSYEALGKIYSQFEK